MSTFFITGATGIVGSAVVARLLAEPHVRVKALVRAPTIAQAAARLSSLVGAAGRLDAIAGDAEQPRFGLDASQYAALAASCTHVVHCAGAVRMNLPLEAARCAAVGSMRNVLELCRELTDRGRLVKLEAISTVGVAGRDHRVLPEDWVGEHHRFHNTYEQAKAEAEQLTRAAAEAGIPLTVHRPSMVVGDSRTGRASRFQIFYYLLEFLTGRRTAGVLPAFGDACLDVVPVDLVAEAIVRSSRGDRGGRRILHLCAGQEAIPLRRLQALVGEALGRRGARMPRPKFVPAPVFVAAASALRLFADAKLKSALGTLPVFLEYLQTNQRFANEASAAWLRRAGIPMPPVHEFLPRVIDYYFDTTRQARENVQ